MDGRPHDGRPDFGLPSRWVEPLARAVLTQRIEMAVVLDAELRVLATNVTDDDLPEVPVRPGVAARDILAALDAPEAVTALEHVLQSGEQFDDRTTVLHTRGPDHRPVHLRLAALRIEDVTESGADAGEPPYALLLVLTDVTDEVRASARLEHVRDAALILGTSLDVVETAQQLADLFVPSLADLATIHLAEAVLIGEEPGRGFRGDIDARRVAVASGGKPWPATMLPAGQRIPPLPDIPEVRAFQSGETVLIPNLAEHLRKAPVVDLAYRRTRIPEDAHSIIAAPLVARGLVLGGVQLWRTTREEAFDEQDARIVEEIVSRAALSVDNARRYTREHRVALSLQHSLLPAATVEEPGAETFGIYLPTVSSAGVGGDWYDVIPLSSLRLAFVVGDVVGHGLRASATMGRLRTAVQTLADMDLGPDELLTHVDDLVLRLGLGPGDDAAVTGATCLYVEYDPVSGVCRMASAGHPPPALLTPDGHARFADLEAGPPLGIGGMPFEISEFTLEPGSVLALYSDGLVEGADHDIDAGMRRLLDNLEQSGCLTQDLAKAGRDLLDATAAASPDDDTTLLLARVRPLPEADSAAWELPADPECVARARDLTAERLAAWGLDELAFTAELVVSELVTNAVRYGGGPCTLRLLRGTNLICEVSDPSNTQPRLRRARTTDEGGRGLFLVAQLTARWGSRYQQSGKTIWAELPSVPNF